MPTNLPPEYYEAERKYKEALSIGEKTDALEEILSTIPKHKGTDKLRADYRRKLSKLRTEAHSQKKVTRHESQFHIEKEGDARILIVGSANTGKSSLVSLLSHANPEISESPFSTWAPTPGMFEINEVHLQLIDTPPINRDYIEPECYDLLRTADLIIIMIDLQTYPIRQIEETLTKLEEGKIAPLKRKGDYKEKVLKYIPMMVVVNKMDDSIFKDEYDVLEELLSNDWSLIPISIKNKFNLDGLAKEILNKMDIIRVYSKPPHHEADLSRPFVLKRESTVGDFAEKVHHDFYDNLKSARVWGSGLYDGQQVGKDHVLGDGDIVELHL